MIIIIALLTCYRHPAESTMWKLRPEPGMECYLIASGEINCTPSFMGLP